MTETLVPIALFLALAFAIVGVTKIVSDGRTRRQLIAAGVTAEVAQAITAPPRAELGLHAALKWGLVIGAVGLSLIVVQFIPYRPDEPIAFGIVLLFVALGLLAYYVVGQRMMRHGQQAVAGTR